MGSAHSSHTSPARGISRGWVSRIRCSTASGSVTPRTPPPGIPRTSAWSPARWGRWRRFGGLLDHDPDDLGGGLDDGHLHRALQRAGRGGAPVAAPEQAQLDRTQLIVDAQAARRRHRAGPGTDARRRAPPPPGCPASRGGFPAPGAGWPPVRLRRRRRSDPEHAPGPALRHGRSPAP